MPDVSVRVDAVLHVLLRLVHHVMRVRVVTVLLVAAELARLRP